MSLQQSRERDPRLVALDVAETFAVLLVPTVVVGGGLALVGGSTGLATGLFAGGVVGAVLARGRWTLQAVRTDDGIKREPRAIPSPESTQTLEYDERYDTLLAVVLALVGVGAVAAFLFGDLPGDVRFWVVVLGIFSWTATLLVVGVRSA